MLTSGAASACTGGEEVLRKLLQLRDTENAPEVLIGAGVNAAVITHMRQQLPGAGAFHMSGKMLLESSMQFRRADIPMGLPGLDEWHLQQTDALAIRAARQALYDL